MTFPKQSNEQTLINLSEQVQADTAAFIQKIFADDPLTMVVKAHLYIESVLSRLIATYLENPKALDLERMPFSQKVQLGISLGLIDRREKRALIGLNRIRNRFVHNLEAVLSKEDAADLLTDLSASDQRRVQRCLEMFGVTHGTYMETLSMIFTVLYMKYLTLAKGLTLLRNSGISREIIVARLRELY